MLLHVPCAELDATATTSAAVFAAIGFGTTSVNAAPNGQYGSYGPVLQQGIMRRVTDTTCKSQYYNFDPASMFCAGGVPATAGGPQNPPVQDACQVRGSTTGAPVPPCTVCCGHNTV